MFVVVANLESKPEYREAFLAAARKNSTASTSNEPGRLRFDILEDESDRNKFVFVEVYHGGEAFEAHNESPHFAEMLATTKHMKATEPEVVACRSHWPADERWS